MIYVCPEGIPANVAEHLRALALKECVIYHQDTAAEE